MTAQQQTFRVLVIGEAAAHVKSALDTLHAQRPIDTVLYTSDTPAGHQVWSWWQQPAPQAHGTALLAFITGAGIGVKADETDADRDARLWRAVQPTYVVHAAAPGGTHAALLARAQAAGVPVWNV